MALNKLQAHFNFNFKREREKLELVSKEIFIIFEALSLSLTCPLFDVAD